MLLHAYVKCEHRIFQELTQWKSPLEKLLSVAFYKNYAFANFQNGEPWGGILHFVNYRDVNIFGVVESTYTYMHYYKFIHTRTRFHMFYKENILNGVRQDTS